MWRLLDLTTGTAFYLTLLLYYCAPSAWLFATATPARFAVRLRQAARKASEDGLGGAVARDQGDLAKAAGGPFPYTVEVPVARLVLVAWQGAGGVVGMTVTVFGDERGGCCRDARAACEARACCEVAAAGAVGKDGQQGKWRFWGCDGGGFRGV
jgi:hypothetical protein